MSKSQQNGEEGRRRIDRWLSLAFLVIIVAGLALYVVNNRDVFRAFLDIHPLFVLLIVPMRLVSFLLLGWQRNILYRLFGLRLDFTEWFGLAVVNTAANTFLPLQSGMAFSALYLKRKRNFALSDFSSSYLAILVISVGASSVLGLAALLLMPDRSDGASTWLAWVFLAVITVCVLPILLLPYGLERFDNRVVRFLRRVLQGWRIIRGNVRVLAQGFAIAATNTIVLALAIYFAYQTVSIQAGFLPVLVLSALTTFAFLVRLTPGNFGVQESILAVVSGMVGIGFDEGLAMAVVYRATSLGLLLILALPFSAILSGRLRQSS